MGPKTKNIILFSVVLLAQLPSIFYGLENLNEQRIWLSITHARPKETRIDFFTMYYANAISFIIMASMLHYPKYLNKGVTRFILIVCYLDLLHLVLFAKQGFGMAKIGGAIVLWIGYEIVKKLRNG